MREVTASSHDAHCGMVKAIFWDNDGVLVDTERLYFQATQETLATVGVSLTREQYIELFLVQGKGAWDLAEERGATPSEVELLRRDRNERYSALLAQGELLIPGVVEVLQALHGSYRMGVVTSSRQDHFAIIHRTTGLLPYFDFVLTASDFTHTKPHPEPYLRALERSGCRPEECLVIEDSARGLAAATAAGLRCVVIPSPFTRHSNFSGAYKILDCLDKLVDELAIT